MTGAGRSGPVPMHPEATDDPQVLRWVIPAGTLTVLGAVTDVPAGLAALQRAGMVAHIDVAPRAVDIRLGDVHSWQQVGATVRDALADALTRPGEWIPAGTVTDDDLLTAALTDVLDGATGDYIRSHGGEVTVLSVGDGCAQVRMTGACSHCPALGFTLHARLERQLRARYPRLVELTAG